MGAPTEVAAKAAQLRRAPKQLDMLRRVVATNGGGLNAYSAPRATWKALFEKGLVQGKSGLACCIVHTRLGLEVVRFLKAGESS